MSYYRVVGTPAAPKSSYSSLAAPKSSYASGYQFQSLVNPTVMSGNRFKFGNATGGNITLYNAVWMSDIVYIGFYIKIK